MSQTKLNTKPATGTASIFPKFKCNYPNCSFSVRRMALLKNHMRNHSQEKPFKCRFCTYSTQSRSNCKVHEQRMHTFQRPHKCRYCAYSCVQSTTLRQHVQMKHRERCQYRCFRCPNFHCQRESQLMFHLLKVHQTMSITEISPYLNPNYLPDHMFPINNLPAVGEFNPNPTEEQRIFAVGSSAIVQQQQPAEAVPSQPHQNRRYSATPYKLVRAAGDIFPANANTSQGTPRTSQALTAQTSTTGPVGSTWPSAGKKAAAQYRREQQSKRQASLNDLSDHCLLTSSSLIAPLDDAPEVIEITENDEEISLLSQEKPEAPHQEQADGGIYVCNHCLMSFHDESSFMNHLVTSHADGAQLEHMDADKDSSQLQETCHQDSCHQDTITSSSGMGFTYPAMVETPPVPVSITQGEFATPTAIKQEGVLGVPLLGQEGWPSTPQGEDKVGADAGLPRRERADTDAIPESMMSPGLHIRQRSTSVASHDSSLGQVASAREGTPLLDMPSPTTTHSNNATASTQTTPFSTGRGGPSPAPAKFCCAHCNIIFPDSVLFTIHRGAHGFHSPFACNFCGKDCGNKYEFASHLHNCS